jgi:predicted  nucleic acid-binding Zn-ribbon protein
MTDQNQSQEPLRRLSEELSRPGNDGRGDPSPEERFRDGLSAFQQVTMEAEVLRRQVGDLQVQKRELTVEVETLRGHLDVAEQRIQAANVARDQAIAERAALEALFQVVRRALDEELPRAVVRAPSRVRVEPPPRGTPPAADATEAVSRALETDTKTD